MESDGMNPLATAQALTGRQEFYSFSEEGESFEFDVTLAWYLVWCVPRETCRFSITDAGIDRGHICQRYPTLDWDYARTTDLSKPLLFIPWKGRNLLIDGWHRLAHAVLKGVEELEAYCLSEYELDLIWCGGDGDGPDG